MNELVLREETDYERQKILGRPTDPWPECPLCETMPDRERDGSIFRCLNKSCTLNQRPFFSTIWRSSIFYRAIRLSGCPRCDNKLTMQSATDIFSSQYKMQIACSLCGFKVANLAIPANKASEFDIPKTIEALIRIGTDKILLDLKMNYDEWQERCVEERKRYDRDTPKSVEEILNRSLLNYGSYKNTKADIKNLMVKMVKEEADSIARRMEEMDALLIGAQTSTQPSTKIETPSAPTGFARARNIILPSDED